MPQLILLLMVFSFFSAGCGIDRPDADLCIINAPNKILKCYNMKRDYDDDGHLLTNAKAIYKSAATVEDLNKGLFVEVNHIAPLKTYIEQLRDAYKNP